MSAYEEFWEEKQEIDALMEKGFTIVGVAEIMDGMDVRFAREASEPNQTGLRLLSADARKYIVGLIIEKQRKAL
ncbi:hypothetical protein [Paenibacillus abyssi]|uniref:Uncharacterized protein n=1 Tax=Paenibacillus abyssi TaxID=1340531 RepID=A0A917FNX0_9BACL|nr:hypothetical protein [Paenibacillus abyssi]GGF94867.1 hypothetical protein GCM10010916_10300 [Paenibacillus abyssi]